MTNCLTGQLEQAQASIELPEIIVNGVEIDKAALSAEVQYHEAENLGAAVQQAGQALVIRELLRQQISETSLASTNYDEERAFAETIAENTQCEPVQESDSRRYYQQSLDKFKTSPIIEVSHILLPAAPNDTSKRIEQKLLSENLLMQLNETPERFVEFAMQYSACPSKETKGSLGQISSGQTVVEFERQLFALDEGLHDRALESRYGYHIVYIHKKIDGKQLEFSMVEDQIDKYLNHRRYRQAVADYLYRLAEASDIRGFSLELEQENIYIG